MGNTSKTILIVDDDREFSASVAEWLTAKGFRVVAAYDGASGLEVAQREQPSLMILDVMMGTETEGLDLSRKIAAIPELKHIPVLLLTGIRRAKNLPFGLEPDADWLPVRAVLEKPLAPEVLLKHVDEALAGQAGS